MYFVTYSSNLPPDLELNRFQLSQICMAACYISLLTAVVHFYRAMHYSAKRGIAIACCLSLRPSVTLVDQDHIGWKFWKLIAWTLSPTPSLFGAQGPFTYSQGNMGKFWGD